MFIKLSNLKNIKASLRGRFAAYIISVIIIFIAAIIFLLGIFGILNPANKRISKELDSLLLKHSEVIEHDVDELAACAISLSEQLENDVQSYLSKNNLSFEDLKNNGTALDELQNEMYGTLYLNMQVAHPSGAFFILDTTVNTNSQTPYYSGIYLKYINLFSENTVNNDFSMFRGSYSTGHSNAINFHSGWRNECKTDFFASGKAQFDGSVRYALSSTVEIPDTWEKARYVYVPIHDIKGDIIGVCGFEISDLLFRLSHKADESDLGLIVCGLIDEKDSSYTGQFNSGRYNISESNNEQPTISEKGNLTHFDFGTEKCIGKTDIVSIGSNNFIIAVMMPESSYDDIITKEQLKLVLIFLIIAVLALCCCIYMSKKYISPIVRKFDQIKSKEKCESTTKITEIDDLFVFLEQKDLYFEEQLKTLEAAKQIAEDEASKTKTAYDTALKEYELAKLEIERLSDAHQSEINAEDYSYFINSLGTLTSTESKIYELYLDGKKADEISDIMGITQNTLKYHNKNIYSKLGISSRKQLLKYASLKKYQDKTGKENNYGKNLD